MAYDMSECVISCSSPLLHAHYFVPSNANYGNNNVCHVSCHYIPTPGFPSARCGTAALISGFHSSIDSVCTYFVEMVDHLVPIRDMVKIGARGYASQSNLDRAC